MTSRLMRAMRFGIFVGILFSAILLYLPKVVSEQCGSNGSKEYSFLGSEPWPSPIPSDSCGKPPIQEQLMNEINNQSEVINAEAKQIVNVDVEKSFPVEDLLSKYINMEYLESKPHLYKNFMTFMTLGTAFFFLFAPPKGSKLLRRLI